MTTSESANKCADCKHAEFADYDNMTCSKGVTATKRSNCDLFEALLTDKEPASYLLSGKLNEIIEEDKAISVEIEKEKQQNVQIISIKNTETAQAKELDNRIYTTAEVQVYSDYGLFHQEGLLPAGKLIKFRREVIRQGYHLLKMTHKESNCYIDKNLSKFKICEQCKVNDEPLDIILLSHSNFDKHFVGAESGKRKVDDKFKDEITSLIEFKDNQTIIRIIDKIKKDSQVISIFNILLLKDELKDVQIGRLDPDAKFYISETTQNKNVKKIVTTDEREAILISHPDAYKVIADPLWTAITVITVIATIIIALYIIVSVVSATGYLVFWAFGLIIIGYLIFIFVGAPIYLIANRIRKYL
jgi:hypothetical protein